MQPDELRTILTLLGMSERGLGRHTGYSPGAVRMWIEGKAAVPEPVAAWLRRRAEDWQLDPPPQRRAAA